MQSGVKLGQQASLVTLDQELAQALKGIEVDIRSKPTEQDPEEPDTTQRRRQHGQHFGGHPRTIMQSVKTLNRQGDSVSGKLIPMQNELKLRDN